MHSFQLLKHIHMYIEKTLNVHLIDKTTILMILENSDYMYILIYRVKFNIPV